MCQPKVADLFAGCGGIGLAFTQAGFKVGWACEINEKARDTYEANLGHRPHGDIFELPWDELPATDVVAGGFPCFAAGTMILTRVGYRPIEDVEVGEEVLTHLGRWKRVTATMRREQAPICRVFAQGVPGVAVTREHPFYVRTRTRKVVRRPKKTTIRLFSEPQWVEAGDLSRDCFLGQVLPPEEDAPDVSAPTLRLLGRLLADGWVTKSWARRKRASSVYRLNVQARICCGKSESVELSELFNDARVRFSIQEGETALVFCTTNQRFVQMAETVGHGAANKRVPGWVMALPQAKAEAFLSGYLSGDGSAEADVRLGWSASYVSRALALGIALLAHRARRIVGSVGYHATNTKKNIQGREVNQLPYYRPRLCRNNRTGFIEGEYGWKAVRRVVDCGKATVFNLAIDEDQSYTADGAIVHNCQPYSKAGFMKGFEDPRADTFNGMMEVVRRVQPRVVLGENVSGLLQQAKGDAFRKIVESLYAAGYGHVQAKVLDATEYGAAQHRERLFIVASHGSPFDFDDVRKAPAARLADVLEPDDVVEWMNPSEYTLIDSPKVQNSGLVFAGYRNKGMRYPDKDPRRSGNHYQQNRIYSSRGVFQTVSSQEISGRHWVEHGGLARRLTRLEIQRLQGFPDDYKFVHRDSFYQQVGNSVYVPCVRAIAEAIGRQFFGFPSVNSNS